MEQEEINKLIVENGAGNLVVRLKGGDPYIFGRGGEEGSLRRSGVEPEVVNRISLHMPYLRANVPSQIAATAHLSLSSRARRPDKLGERYQLGFLPVFRHLCFSWE